MWESNNFPGKQSRMTLVTNKLLLQHTCFVIQTYSSGEDPPHAENGIYHAKDYSSVG